MKREILDLYKEIYFKEVERRKAFNDSILIPITLLTGSYSILFYLISSFSFEDWKVLDFSFLFLSLCSFVTLINCTFYSIKFFSNATLGFNTADLPNPKEIEEYREQLLKKFKDEKIAFDKFTDWLTAEYIRCATNYQQKNDIKLNYYFSFKKTFILVLISLLVTTIFFLSIEVNRKNGSNTEPIINIYNEK